MPSRRRRGARKVGTSGSMSRSYMRERFIHGTTVATNAILEQKGATTGILTTEGFEDVLEMGRLKRSRMYDLDMDPEVPTFLAPRRRRLGIRERLDARGHVLVPLHEADVRRAVET